MKIQMYIPFSTLGKYLKRGGELSWEEPWQRGFPGKSEGCGLSCQGGSEIWGGLQSSPVFISFDFP